MSARASGLGPSEAWDRVWGVELCHLCVLSKLKSPNGKNFDKTQEHALVCILFF